jgi:gamma-D-glutamyl-L-lysine dipeptidyl-peptidase
MLLKKFKFQLGFLMLALLCSLFVLKERIHTSDSPLRIDTPHASNHTDLAEKHIPISSSVSAQQFYINEPAVDILAEPTPGSETVTQALYGEPVTVIKHQGIWSQVMLPDQYDYEGWLKDSQVKVSPPTTSPKKRKVVAVKTAKVYTQPWLESSTVTTLSLGALAEVSLPVMDSTFTTIQLVDGQQGYIRTSELLDYEPSHVQISAKNIQGTAAQLLGQPYLWGGMTTAGVDCSGFIHTVFKVQGIRLHRDADQQFFKDGIRVEKGDLQVGDLVFFETYAPGPSHVGIYIGDHQFIQAGSSGVSYASLDSPYFADRFLGAKRILEVRQP